MSLAVKSNHLKNVYLTYESRNKKYIIMLSMIRKYGIVGTKSALDKTTRCGCLL